ncbi:aspartate aminotransferase family protein [Marinomonas pollencensis]|uniref:Taurine-pyruvate aminotransferase n=1 Tax=Marinomonas pollencensis TaxID=491954 RepID=A0A3E0DT22_9GAMM|nr:aminotransferase class III-fold pyridoxal phosphate-dependent enzyme [Marinomonas pollencensis]REG85623.1 taurine-pyruvate aminotransferase [Marinomonas pollencensis]
MSNLTTEQTINLSKTKVWHQLTQHAAFDAQDPLIMERGEGLYIWDIKGNQYLDASSGGVWCVNVGYGRASMAKVVHDQLLKLNFFASTAGTPIAAEYADKLLEKMPGMGRVYYSSSGSEANEKAYKMVRQIANQKYGGKKSKILYRERDYHGTTFGCLSSTGQEQRRAHYGPFVPGFVEFPHCCEYRSQFDSTENYGLKAAQAFEEVVLREGPDTVGALVIEPITAGGGVITPPEGYLKELERLCRKYNILIIVDEVVCGLGRTGAWFGYQHYGIKPDIVTMAKGVASSYAAISCTVTTEDVFNLFKENPEDKESYYRDVSTYAGCTSGPAAALENMRIIEEENLVENAAHMGEYLLAQLALLKDQFPIIGDVRGKGLLLGLELVKDRVTKEPVDESVTAAVVGLCMKQGLIVGKTNRSFKDFNNTLCLSPALTINQEQADTIVTKLAQALSALPAV